MLQSEKLWLSPKQVGELAGGLSAQFIREEIDAGQLEAIVVKPDGVRRLRGRYRVRRDIAAEYASRLRSTGNTQSA